MKYYKVRYTMGKNRTYIYPPGIKGAVWNLAQYHYNKNIMIGKTDSPLKTNKTNVVELSENEALSLIEEFKKSYPKVEIKEPPFLPKTNTKKKSPQKKATDAKTKTKTKTKEKE